MHEADEDFFLLFFFLGSFRHNTDRLLIFNSALVDDSPKLDPRAI